ncbi:MAG: hypothetical protein ACYSTS_15330 [Planctomycetota bacterium]|jgi:hypothetical protein
MRKANFVINVPHLFSPIYAISVEGKSSFIKPRFNVDETLQINASNFLILNKTVLIKVVKNHNILIPS